MLYVVVVVCCTVFLLDLIFQSFFKPDIKKLKIFYQNKFVYIHAKKNYKNVELSNWCTFSKYLFSLTSNDITHNNTIFNLNITLHWFATQNFYLKKCQMYKYCTCIYKRRGDYFEKVLATKFSLKRFECTVVTRQ